MATESQTIFLNVLKQIAEEDQAVADEMAAFFKKMRIQNIIRFTQTFLPPDLPFDEVKAYLKEEIKTHNGTFLTSEIQVIVDALRWFKQVPCTTPFNLRVKPLYRTPSCQGPYIQTESRPRPGSTYARLHL